MTYQLLHRVKAGTAPDTDIPDVTMYKTDRAQALAELNEMGWDDESSDGNIDEANDSGTAQIGKTLSLFPDELQRNSPFFPTPNGTLS
jgi:hypothetical protein